MATNEVELVDLLCDINHCESETYACPAFFRKKTFCRSGVSTPAYEAKITSENQLRSPAFHAGHFQCRGGQKTPDYF